MIEPGVEVGRSRGTVACRESLGGLLRYVMTGDVLKISGSGIPTHEIPLPEPVKHFLAAFNRGDYPAVESGANMGR